MPHGLRAHFGRVIDSTHLVRGVVAGASNVFLEPGDDGYNWLNHHVRDLKTGVVLSTPVLIDARPIESRWRVLFEDVGVGNAGELLARVWESEMAGCEDVATLEAVLREYRVWEGLTPRQRANTAYVMM